MAPPTFIAFVRAHLPPLGLAPDREAEIVEELAQQLEQTCEEALAAGAEPAAAERTAHAVIADWPALARELVDAERSKAEQAVRRIVRPALVEPDRAVVGRTLHEAWQDVRYGVRWMARQRAFTAAALLTLTLTIGASSAIFSLVNAVLLAPLPFPEPDALVSVAEAVPAIGFDRVPFSPPDFLDFAAAQQSFAHVAAYRNASVELAGAGESERIDIAKVSPELFGVLAVQPALGRAFGAEDGRAGADVAILSDGLWRRRFDSDPDVVGRTILLDRRPFVVAGVMPPQAVFPLGGAAFNAQPAQVLVPLVFSEIEQGARGGFFNNSVVARLKPAVSLAAARAEATAIAGRLNERYPPEVRAVLKGHPVEIVLTPFHRHVAGDSRQVLLVLLAAVLLLLLAGCTNVGSLLLAVTTSRQRELAVRASLGAGRARLARQLLAESVVLSVVGGTLGLALAWGLVHAAPQVLPASTPRLTELGIDVRVVLFTALVAMATAAAFGLAPAWRWSRVAPAEAMARTASRGATADGARMRRGLAVAQCAFAVLLLVPAALLGRTLWTLLTRSPGFDAERAVTLSTYLPAGAYDTSGVAVGAFYTEVAERLAALPGVRAAGVSNDRPLRPLERRAVMVEGYDMSGTPPIVLFSWVTPGYLDALGVPRLSGRGLEASDVASTEPVVLVSAGAARTLWPDGDAVGRRLRVSLDAPWAVVAGVVGDIRDNGMASASGMHVYAPIAQVGRESLGENIVGLFRNPTVIVSGTGAAAALGAMARDVIRARDPQLALTPAVPIREAIVRSVSVQRLAAVVVGTFSLAALAIAAAGLHGVLAFGVAQRRREFGIRLALGATPGSMVRLVARDGVVLAIAGLVTGLAAAYGTGSAIRGLLVDVAPSDPATFAVVGVLVLGVAAAATWRPAHSATRIDPAATIREE